MYSHFCIPAYDGLSYNLFSGPTMLLQWVAVEHRSDCKCLEIVVQIIWHYNPCNTNSSVYLANYFELLPTYNLVCQTIWITNVAPFLWGLIWIQNVCNGHQQYLKLIVSEQRVTENDICLNVNVYNDLTLAHQINCHLVNVLSASIFKLP